MLNAIPFIGWFLSLMFSVSLAIPFWITWTICEIGPTYFYWLPPVYQRPGFWSCVGFFLVVSILKAVLVPKLVNVSNEAKSEN